MRYLAGGLLVGVIIYYMFWNKSVDKVDRQVSDNYNYSAKAYFAGGCFWCVEKDFEKVDGVGDVVSGYSGGEAPSPTYTDHADHRESVMVQYDPAVVSYIQLVHYFFRHHDASDAGGSFHDRGHSYTSAIYYQNTDEQHIAQSVRDEVDALGLFDDPIVTSIEPFKDFTVAEDYHQNYYKRDAVSATKYTYYRAASGRDDLIKDIAKREADLQANQPQDETAPWLNYHKPDKDVLRQQLSELEYRVTQQFGTEKPFSTGNLNDENRPGIFVDILSGEPLFASVHKYKSGTGWPSFTQPIANDAVTQHSDYKLIYPRSEVRARHSGNHLGHVFNDGPEPTGQRWCMNGAAMNFVPLEEMEERGYEDYLYFFE